MVWISSSSLCEQTTEISSRNEHFDLGKEVNEMFIQVF